MNNDIKQVLVLRTKYPDGKGGFFKPRTGKLMAQVSHASMAFLLKNILKHKDYDLQFKHEQWLWMNNLQTKVCLQVDTEEDLLDINKKAQEASLEVHLITDAGLTEFNGVPTLTCIAIGPDYSESIDKITSHLKLY